MPFREDDVGGTFFIGVVSTLNFSFLAHIYFKVDVEHKIA